MGPDATRAGPAPAPLPGGAFGGPDFAERLAERLAAAGAAPRQVARILRSWLRGRGLSAAADARDAAFGRRLRAELLELEAELAAAARIAERCPGTDGS